MKSPNYKVIALCFEMSGQSQPSHARFLPASLLWNQVLHLEVVGKTLDASMMEVAGGLCGPRS